MTKTPAEIAREMTDLATTWEELEKSIAELCIRAEKAEARADANWIAGRDAAAAWCDRFRHPDQGGGLAGSLADGIRALTPPKDK